MKTQTMIRISELVLLAVAVSLAVLALVYVLQDHSLFATLATISWNG